MRHWILKDMKPVEVDMLTWAVWFHDHPSQRVIEQTRIGHVQVSTVFLGFDHGFDEGLPLVFETMIFGGPLDESRWRYTTLGEAKQGHHAAVDRVRAETAHQRN